MVVLSSEELKASYDYEKHLDGTITIKGYKGASEDVVIPAYAVLGGKIHEVDRIDSSAFFNNRSVKSLVIPNTVKEIGLGAFRGCASLESVSIPASVESIEDLAFAECCSLRGFTVDAANERYRAVDGALVSVPDMELILYPLGRKDASYRIPDCIESIGTWAFMDCTSLTAVTIPDSVRSIKEDAFEDCSSLESIAIPDSVVSVGNDAFIGCSSLRSFVVPEDHPSYRSVDGVLFDRDMKMLVQYPLGRGDAEYRIPEPVETVRFSAFEGCGTLESIVFPDSMRTVGEGAFRGCSSLKRIDFGNSELTLEKGAFMDCTSLTAVTIPANVKKIEGGAFNGCSSIGSFEVSEGNRWYRSVDGMLFSGSSLVQYPPKKTDRVLSVDIGEMYEGALYGCPMLEEIIITRRGFHCSEGGVMFDSKKETLVQYPAGKRDAEYRIPGSVKKIGDHAFQGCRYLKRVEIPDTVKDIGWYAFADCESLESVKIRAPTSAIGYKAFRNCPSLTDVEVPEELEAVRIKYSFEGCPIQKKKRD